MSVTGFRTKIGVSFSSTHRWIDRLILRDNVDALRLSAGWTYQNGTGADKANIQWHDQRTLAANPTTGYSENLDLTDLTHASGDQMAFDLVRAIFIQIVTNTGAAGHIIVGVDTTSGAPWSNFIAYSGAGQFGFKLRTGVVRKGGGAQITAPDATGWAVAGGNSKLYIENGTAYALTYNIALIGEGDFTGP